LLNVLRPDVVIDRASFTQMSEPNRYINDAIQACRRGQHGWAEDVRKALRMVASTTWGRNVLSENPGFQHIYDGLADGGDDRESRVRTIHALEQLYTFSPLINRTRRRDIGEFVTRKPETVITEFTARQKALHDDLLSIIAKILRRLHGNQSVKFMMTTVSRQAASSLYGLAPMLEDMLRGKLERLDSDSELVEEYDKYVDDFADVLRDEIDEIISRARYLDEDDPKAAAFLNIVLAKVREPKNKVLAFSTFRHTLAYLARQLEIHSIRFGLVHGQIPDEERASLRQRFKLNKEDSNALDVLLSSEVGCEGLDFQFCDCLVNYDLPWNPMRIEQRIGRLDRYGQQSDAVGIFNIITPGTIDADIYNRCLLRIGVFQHSIGGNEEILGEITRELQSISEAFSLTEEERAQRLEQLADNKLRQIEEEQKLEERQGELFGLNIAAASWEEKLKRSRNFWLEPSALANAVSTYLARRAGQEQEHLLGEKSVKTLRLNADARAALLEDFRKIPRSTDPVYRLWERWLKGTSPVLQITFDQEAAFDNDEVVLLSLSHPLIRQASSYLCEREPVYTKLRSHQNALPHGVHPFAVYKWSRQGLRRDEELVPVCADAQIAAALIELLATAEFSPDLQLPEQRVLDALDALHHQQWSSAAAAHAEENHQLVSIQLQSLTASHRARTALLQERVAGATNEKIKVMKMAELERAETDYQNRIKQINMSAQTADIRATPVVFGIIEIQGLK